MESFKIMDYSLLVGIHNLDLAAKERVVCSFYLFLLLSKMKVIYGWELKTNLMYVEQHFVTNDFNMFNMLNEYVLCKHRCPAETEKNLSSRIECNDVSSMVLTKEKYCGSLKNAYKVLCLLSIAGEPG